VESVMMRKLSMMVLVHNHQKFYLNNLKPTAGAALLFINVLIRDCIVIRD
jgi:hypothetical protein